MKALGSASCWRVIRRHNGENPDSGAERYDHQLKRNNSSNHLKFLHSISQGLLETQSQSNISTRMRILMPLTRAAMIAMEAICRGACQQTRGSRRETQPCFLLPGSCLFPRSECAFYAVTNKFTKTKVVGSAALKTVNSVAVTTRALHLSLPPFKIARTKLT